MDILGNNKTTKEKYYNAHLEWFKRTYPQAWKDNHYSVPVIPPIKKSNGLTRYIVNVLHWLPKTNGTRVSSAGRLVDGVETGPTGNKIGVKKFIPSTTRRGTADVTATVVGRSVKWEIKVGADKPSPYQLAEQKREQEAGGFYFFVHTPEEFWQQLEQVLSL